MSTELTRIIHDMGAGDGRKLEELLNWLGVFGLMDVTDKQAEAFIAKEIMK